jgi:hypothetical protein
MISNVCNCVEYPIMRFIADLLSMPAYYSNLQEIALPMELVISPEKFHEYAASG